MNEVKGPPAVATMTVSIKRKATGKVETYDLDLIPVDEQPTKPEGEPECPQQ